jgi:hypothetical protein
MEDLSKKSIVSSKIPVNLIKSTLTPNGNLLSYSMNTIDLYNLSTDKIIFTEQKKLACCAYVTPMNTRIFCGHVDGTLESRDPTTLAVLQTVKLNSKILDNKTLYVGLRNGRIVALAITDLNAPLVVIKTINKKNPISMLKLSKDKSFLLGYVDVDGNETFYVINLAKKDGKPWFGTLDLAPGQNREDPQKLLVISENCLNVFARGENNKGVVMYSMFDGSIVVNMTAMHTNYIL